MSNVNSVTTYTSSTGLSTATVTDYFNDSNTHIMDSLKAVCLVNMLAETGFQATGTGRSMSIPLFAVRAESFIPTKYLVELAAVGSFPAGTEKATATLVWQLATAAIPTTLALGGNSTSGFTPVITSTVMNPIVAASATAVAPNTLITAASTVGTSVPATVDQNYQGIMVLTSTTKSIVLPGKALYINLTTGGTISTADLTVTGSWRFYIYGNTRVAP